MANSDDAYFEARPKGALTGRHKKALRDAGFGWIGSAWIRKGHGPRPWGCTVRRYRPPVDTSPMAAIFGMLSGTHDEFGRRKH